MPVKRELGHHGNIDTSPEQEKLVLNWLREEVEVAYRESITASLSAEGHDLTSIALAAKLHKSNRSRIRTGESVMSWQILFCGVAHSGLELHLARGLLFVRTAAISTTVRIKRELRSEPVDSPFSVEKLECLQAIHRDPHWRDRLANGQELFLRRFSDEVSAQVGSQCLFTVAEIQSILKEWDQAYRHFHSCIGMELQGWWY